MRATSLLSFLVVLGTAGSWTSDARAYCRLRSCQDDLETGRECQRDSTGCITEGDELFYGKTCHHFAVAHGGAELLGLADARFEQIVMRAFDAWRTVDCGRGRTPGFSIQSAGVVESDAPFFCTEPSLNTSVWFLDPTWDRSASALGFTTSIHAVDDGEILDADVELNLAYLASEVAGPVEEVLLAIATHEAGHFLGLAHSDDLDAVMAVSYEPSEVIGRSLTQDDIDGVCAIYPPSGAPDECPTPGVTAASLGEEECSETRSGPASPAASGCSVVASGLSSPGAWTWFAAWVLLLIGQRHLRRRRAVPA